MRTDRGIRNSPHFVALGLHFVALRLHPVVLVPHMALTSSLHPS